MVVAKTPPAKQKRKATAEAKLEKYFSKRDFGVTTEPKGREESSASGFSFVVQKHRATRLHYDFRLELDGVLLSWAVPKGPSMRANEKRLAARTEDHPLDYADFEGIIPRGEYGGGTVLVWDQGTWAPTEDPRRGVEAGKLVFDLHGSKLKGRFHMVRTKSLNGKEDWLLFKGRDSFAIDKEITDEDTSVLSGRTLDEVAAAKERVWHSNHDGPSIVDLVKQIPTSVKFTNLDKVLYSDSGLTKAAVIAYYATMSKQLLRHIQGRPLALLRCPDGIDSCFFQKHGTVPLPKPIKHGDEWLYIDDFDGLMALAQSGVLEVHAWGCRVDSLESPDLLVMDLDPDTDLPWAKLVEGADEVRSRLDSLGLESFVKTTGGKGLHVVVPCAPVSNWDDFKSFAKSLAQSIEADSPNRFTTNIRKANRVGKILIDYLRNGRGATAVAAFSPRARTGATVSWPIPWNELASVNPRQFTILTVPKLQNEAWDGFDEASRQKLPLKSCR